MNCLKKTIPRIEISLEAHKYPILMDRLQHKCGMVFLTPHRNRPKVGDLPKGHDFYRAVTPGKTFGVALGEDGSCIEALFHDPGEGIPVQWPSRFPVGIDTEEGDLEIPGEDVGIGSCGSIRLAFQVVEYDPCHGYTLSLQEAAREEGMVDRADAKPGDD